MVVLSIVNLLLYLRDGILPREHNLSHLCEIIDNNLIPSRPYANALDYDQTCIVLLVVPKCIWMTKRKFLCSMKKWIAHWTGGSD